MDDEPDILRFISRCFRGQGYAVDCASGAAEGLELTRNREYDMIVLDLMMPDIDGVAALTKLVAADPDQRILVLSARTTWTPRSGVWSSGAVDYLTKPFALAELVARVRARLPSATHAPQDCFIRAAGITLDLQRHTADAGDGPDPALRARVRTAATSDAAGGVGVLAPAAARRGLADGVRPRDQRRGYLHPTPPHQARRRGHRDAEERGLRVALDRVTHRREATCRGRGSDRWPEALVGAVVAFGTVFILAVPGWEALPFNLIWISATVLYGHRRWPPRVTALVLLAITVLTTSAVLISGAASEVRAAEIAEIPVVCVLFGVVIWHVKRAHVLEHVNRAAARERDFVRDISHQLRTPITIARGHAELIEADQPGSTAARDARVVVAQLERLQRISDRLLVLVCADHPEFLEADPADGCRFARGVRLGAVGAGRRPPVERSTCRPPARCPWTGRGSTMRSMR